MGKLFEKELRYLSNTVEEAMQKDISNLISFFENYTEKNMLLIGSGGSFSVACAVEYMTGLVGYFAKAVTPYELLNLIESVHNSAVMLFTAGGGNKDTLNAYRFVSDLEPIDCATVCVKKDAPIKKIQKNNIHNFYYEMELLSGKDGYLAVNSLIASIVVVSNALYQTTANKFFRVETLLEKELLEFDTEIVDAALGKETLIVLYGGMTAPVARDMESKFSEASLGNIQMVDYRNFAHGRHFWLKDRENSTSIIMLQGPTEKEIAKRTKELLPEEIPVLEVESNRNDINGMLELYQKMFLLVNRAGTLRGINPGKPSVAGFGRKLYHLNYNISKEEQYVKYKKDVLEFAVLRKFGYMNEEIKDCYKKIASNLIQKQEKTKFKGLVMDYDGTLHDKSTVRDSEINIWKYIEQFLQKGIAVGIATGRGKSVREEIKEKISEDLLGNIWIAYYNGGVIGKADDNTVPDVYNKQIPKDYEAIREKLHLIYGKENINIDLRPYQLTILGNKQLKAPFKDVISQISEYSQYKMVISSHSADVIPLEEGKENLLTMWAKKGIADKGEVLCIGDSGNFGGNDYELLDRWNGISVDKVSNRVEACWNWAPMGKRNLDATLYYFQHMDMSQDGYFKVKWGMKTYADRTGGKNTNGNNGVERNGANTSGA